MARLFPRWPNEGPSGFDGSVLIDACMEKHGDRRDLKGPGAAAWGPGNLAELAFLGQWRQGLELPPIWFGSVLVAAGPKLPSLSLFRPPALGGDVSGQLASLLVADQTCIGAAIDLCESMSVGRQAPSSFSTQKRFPPDPRPVTPGSTIGVH
jgi:hypothetical protein